MKSCKVALVHPDYNSKVEETLSVPLGLAWICAYLKKYDIDVECYDYSALGIKSNRELKDNDIICVQVHSHETLSESIKFIENIKLYLPESIIIVGGIIPTLDWNKLKEYKFIDIIIVGEGEICLKKTIQSINKNNGKINKEEIRLISGAMIRDEIKDKKDISYGEIIQNLDELPDPDRDAFGCENYKQWSIITSRGCPYKCRFCTVPSFYNGRIRYRGIQSVINEILDLNTRFGMTKFFILDDTFTINRQRVIEFSQSIIETNIKFEWVCLVRLDTIDDEMLKIMRQAGCVQVSCGVESINQKTLNYLQKGITKLKIERGLKLLKANNFRIRTSFIFGLPTEDEEDINNTIDFICEYEPDEVQIYPYMPYTGTELSKEVEAVDFYNDRIIKNSSTPLVNSKISKEEISSLVQLCVNRLKLKGYFWVPGDKKVGKSSLNKVVMTEFCPVQTLD